MTDLTPIFAALEERLKTTENPFAVFDFDRTCFWDNDCEEVAQYYLAEQGLLRDNTLFGKPEPLTPEYHRRAFLHYFELIKEGKIEESYYFTKQFFVGFTYDELRSITREAIKTQHQDRWETHDLWGRKVRRGLQVHPVVESLLDYCRERGIQTNVVSAAVTPCLEVGVEALLNKKVDQRFGVPIKTDQEDKIINEYAEPNPMFGGKVKVIQHYIHPTQRPILAVGDSVGDEKMLEYSETKVVIDHQNAVSRRAKKEGWFLVPNLRPVSEETGLDLGKESH